MDFTHAFRLIDKNNKAVFEAQAKHVTRRDEALLLAGADAMTRVLALVYEAEDGVGTIAAMNKKTPIACSPGCHFCCFLMVAVSELEAQGIAQYIFQTMGLGGAMLLLAATQARAAMVKDCPRDGEAYLEQELPCLLLREGQCSVYPVRPMACVGYHSLSRADCEAGHHKAVDSIPYIGEYVVYPTTLITRVTAARAAPGRPKAGEMNAFLAEALRDQIALALAQEPLHSIDQPATQTREEA